MSSPHSVPPSGAELGRWAVALQTRIDNNPASAPMRYVTRGLLEVGHVRVASFLSPLLPKIPQGFTPDCIVLRLCTATQDGPLQWPRKLLRLSGHVLEGRTPEMDPVEPPLWTLTFLPPAEPIPTGFVVDLIGLGADGTTILIDPETNTVPRAEVPPEPEPLWTPEARQRAFCGAAWKKLDQLGVSAGIAEVLPVAQGVLRLPPDDKGLTPQVAQVVVRVTVTPLLAGLVPLHEVFDAASFEVRQAIEAIQVASAPPVGSAPAISSEPASTPSE